MDIKYIGKTGKVFGHFVLIVDGELVLGDFKQSAKRQVTIHGSTLIEEQPNELYFRFNGDVCIHLDQIEKNIRMLKAAYSHVCLNNQPNENTLNSALRAFAQEYSTNMGALDGN